VTLAQDILSLLGILFLNQKTCYWRRFVYDFINVLTGSPKFCNQIKFQPRFLLARSVKKKSKMAASISAVRIISKKETNTFPGGTKKKKI
jgi:hypothetical protein